MQDRYRYENLNAPKFQRLVESLVANDPHPDGDTVVQVRFTTLAHHLNANTAARWLATTINLSRAKLTELAAGGVRHYLLATNYALIGQPEVELALKLSADLAERAKDYGLESLSVWWRHDVDTRFAAAPKALHVEFADVLHKDDINSIPGLEGRLIRARRERIALLAGVGISDLPIEFTQITNLRELYLRGNNLTRLPAEIGRLVNLEILDLAGNKLTNLPAEIRHLTKLKSLRLQDNSLHAVPYSVRDLVGLSELHLHDNQIAELPSELGGLANLELLDVRGNKIKTLPSELGDRVADGLIMKLDNNPLSDPLPDLIERGPDALATYLRSLTGATIAHYEAKVILVGEGNVGKTSLVAAVRGAPFVENRLTTHGIEIRPLVIMHPNENVRMTVRTWDFGGQEVYRITHQFFFSRRALYLVVWNARQGQEQDEVEGWLRRIQLRVGPNVRILLVATHCDERQPEIDYPRLNRIFAGMLNGHFKVDSRTGSGIDGLRTAIARQVSQLPHMGQLLNRNWISARDEILDNIEPQISYEEFVETCKKHDLDSDEISTLAELLHDLGRIVYYGDDDGLRDVVVLDPEWLTKAIGYVLEDLPTRNKGGVLDHARLSSIWQNTPDGFSYPTKYHPFFLRLMEKFDVSYRLEDGQHSLVAQLVSHEQPDLPWGFDTRLPEDTRSLAFTCQLSEPAPGLIAWLTVRHHRASIDKHWRRGVFLRHPVPTYASEALLELRSDRELYVEVRAPSPDMYFNVLRESTEDLLRRRWPGLTYQLSIPCPTRACPGRFPLEGLLRHREAGGVAHTCLDCNTTHDVPGLLTGFSVPSPTLQPMLERLEQEVSKMAHGVSELQRRAADAADSLNRVLKTVAVEVNDCPRLFTLTPAKSVGWERLKRGQRRYRLILWCEHPGEWHAWPKATYRVEQPREWLLRVGPYANLIFKTLRLVVPIAKDIAGITLSEAQLKETQAELELMKTLVDKLPGAIPHEIVPSPAVASSLTAAEGEALRALRVLLFGHDHGRTFGGLRRVHAPSGEFLWVCADHYRHFDPGLPVLPVTQADLTPAVPPWRALGADARGRHPNPSAQPRGTGLPGTR